MADRPEVATASAPVTALALLGLGDAVLNGLARVPFRQFWKGPSGLLDNVGQSVTRQAARSFMGYIVGLPIEEFRSMEKAIDEFCQVVIPPFIRLTDHVAVTPDEINGVPGLWLRPRASSAQPGAGERPPSVDGTILYLHGGGYVGTTPMMYSVFAASLVSGTGCEVFIADYRMAPEFPFPAAVHDAAAVYRGVIARGAAAEHVIVAGDSGGGGLATSLVAYLHDSGLPTPAAIALFSPEVDLDMDHPSITENARTDILPWNVPVTPYLHGVQPDDKRVSIINAEPDPAWFPPTYVCWGADEMFRDPIRDFVAGLDNAGVEVFSLEATGMFHVFPILMPWAESAHEVYRTLDDFVDRHVAPGPEATPTL